MDRILAALGLAKGTDEDGVLAAINTQLINGAAVAKAAGLAETAKPAEVLAAVTAMSTDRRRLAQAAGLGADAKADDVVTAVQSAVRNVVDPAKFVPVEQVRALQEDFKTLKDELNGGKAEAAVNSAISLGKVPPSLKEWALDFATKDLAGFEAYSAKAPSLTKSQLEEPGRRAAGDADLDDPTVLAAAAATYQKKCADAGQTIDFATAVMSVKEGKK